MPLSLSPSLLVVNYGNFFTGRETPPFIFFFSYSFFFTSSSHFVDVLSPHVESRLLCCRIKKSKARKKNTIANMLRTQHTSLCLSLSVLFFWRMIFIVIYECRYTGHSHNDQIQCQDSNQYTVYSRQIGFCTHLRLFFGRKGKREAGKHKLCIKTNPNLLLFFF